MTAKALLERNLMSGSVVMLFAGKWDSLSPNDQRLK
jgi:hypothetical protein